MLKTVTRTYRLVTTLLPGLVLGIVPAATVCHVSLQPGDRVLRAVPVTDLVHAAVRGTVVRRGVVPDPGVEQWRVGNVEWNNEVWGMWSGVVE